ncbi:hypothetical protein NQZ68_039879 [Dissostichus eleginoides]|nr:hypothetical protein NQZ68_039879 [Dissostichus eleginoides]
MLGESGEASDQLAAPLLAARGKDSTVHEAGTISTGKVRNREVRVADRSNLGQETFMMITSSNKIRSPRQQ